MILRPALSDFRIIGYYIGKLIIGLGGLMTVPFLTALAFYEISPAVDYLFGMGVCFTLGALLILTCRKGTELNWMNGMVVVSLSWLILSLLSAIPLFLSGHFGSYLDAVFDAMSACTTTGLTLIQDLDHLAHAHNMWRHFLMFIFGQGIMVIALTFFLRGVAGVLPMYVAEGRDEKILPNIAQTARFIWLVSLVYLVLGTLALGGVAWREGMPPVRAFLHGMWLFMAGWDTGGFAPQSQNILYYHSMTIEMVTIVIMILGAMNFKLHHAIWNGDFKEVFRNLEMRTFFSSICLLSLLCLIGLSYTGLYPGNVAIFRKGFYHLISAHTNTGYGTLPTEQFVTIWGHDAVLALILAMAIGGGASSTAGGIKLMRVGIIFKALLQEIKRLMSPEASVVIQKIHHLRDMVMEERQVRNAGLITLCFILLFLLGVIAGVLAGYPLLESMFESVSASTNTGLSAGITAPSMPAVLKVTYIFQMWTGRLEFMSVFVFLGFIFALMAGK